MLGHEHSREAGTQLLHTIMRWRNELLVSAPERPVIDRIAHIHSVQSMDHVELQAAVIAHRKGEPLPQLAWRVIDASGTVQYVCDGFKAAWLKSEELESKGISSTIERAPK